MCLYYFLVFFPIYRHPLLWCVPPIVVFVCVCGFGGGSAFGQGGCDPSSQSCQPDGQVSVDPGGGQVQSGGQGSSAPQVSVDPGGVRVLLLRLM